MAQLEFGLCSHPQAGSVVITVSASAMPNSIVVAVYGSEAAWRSLHRLSAHFFWSTIAGFGTNLHHRMDKITMLGYHSFQSGSEVASTSKITSLSATRFVTNT